MSEPASLGLILVAAGNSARMRGIDKVWSLLHDQPVLAHSLRALGPHAGSVVLVVRESDVARARQEFGSLVTCVVPGGHERHASVRAGLEHIGPVDAVAVHDAARPLARPSCLQRGLSFLDTYHGAVPGTPLRDTVKRVDGAEVVLDTVDRVPLRVVQTPQVFRRESLLRAHRESGAGDLPTDDAALLERIGLHVRVFEGDPDNIKITTPFDLEIAGALLDLRRVGDVPGA